MGHYLADRTTGDTPGRPSTRSSAPCRVRTTGEVCLVAGAQDLVRAVAARVPVALASSAPRRIIDTVMEAMGLGPWFGATVSSSEVAAGKPSPDVYLEAIRRLGIDAAGSFAVEDSSNGIRAAAAAGLTVLAVPHPATRGRRCACAAADSIHARSTGSGDGSWPCSTARAQRRWPVTHIYNAERGFKDEFLDGLTAAYGRYLRRVPGASAVMSVDAPAPGQVSVIIGGGSGHYPAFAGLVGPGLCHGAVVGEVFTSPSATQAYRAIRALDGGAGVLLTFGNYSGDVMHFGLAAEQARAAGIDTRIVLVTDDVASAPPDRSADRRGIAGTFFVFRAAAAAARRGADLDAVERVARHANERTRSPSGSPSRAAPSRAVPSRCSGSSRAPSRWASASTASRASRPSTGARRGARRRASGRPLLAERPAGARAGAGAAQRPRQHQVRGAVRALPVASPLLERAASRSSTPRSASS